MVLRCLLITAFPFREDEAVYSTWALHFLTDEPFFLTVWPDKPPIFLWLLSATFWLFDAEPSTTVEFSARWLNVAASVLTIPLVAAMARRLWGEQAAALSALLLALNPFAIAFAPTGYTDSVLVLWGTAAIFCATVKRPFWAGIWLGLAIMTKQQGLLYVPLIMGLTWNQIQSGSSHLGEGRAPLARNSWKHYPIRGAFSTPIKPYVYSLLALFGPLLLGLGLLILPIVLLDSLRWAVAPSPWDLSIRNYGALILLPIGEWSGRATDWLRLIWYLVGSWSGWALLVATGLLFFSQRRKGAKAEHRLSMIGWLFIVWSAGFLLLHIGTSVQIWDRYLLPLVPVFVLLAGYIWSTVFDTQRQPIGWAFTLLFLGLLIPASWRAAQGEVPIGGDHGDLVGLHEALGWIQRAQNDEPFVLYHQALGPQLRLYLFDEVQQGQADLRWYPHATYLVDNVAKSPHRRKFLIQPDWAIAQPLNVEAATRQLEILPLGRFGRFQLLEVVVNRPSCDWCVCSTGWLTSSTVFSPNTLCEK